MARARNIKPGFFTNDELVELPFEVRLLFIGLWTIADKEGRLADRPKKIKMEIFPADDVDCDKALSLLESKGFLSRYQAAGSSFIQIVNWSRHQNPHIKEAPSSIPAENDAAPEKPVQALEKPVVAGLIPDSLQSDSGLLIVEKDEPPATPPALPGMFDGINPQIVADFKAMRRTQKAPVTQTAIDGIRREAEKAGLTLEAALAVCCERSWRGFKAEWITQPARASPVGAQQLGRAGQATAAAAQQWLENSNAS